MDYFPSFFSLIVPVTLYLESCSVLCFRICFLSNLEALITGLTNSSRTKSLLLVHLASLQLWHSPVNAFKTNQSLNLAIRIDALGRAL